MLCFRLMGLELSEPALCVMMNMSAEALDLPLPDTPSATWRRIADTALPPPEDIVSPKRAKVVVGSSYALASHAVAIFEAVVSETVTS